MATANERRPGTQPEADWKGIIRARRRFVVDLAPINVPRDGSLVGLPGMNEAHPSIPNARVDQINASELPGKANWSEVDVLYSSDRQFGFPTQPLDPTRLDFDSWTISFDDVVTEIPIAKKRAITLPSPSGAAPTTQTAWAYGPQVVLSVIETRAYFTYRFTLTSFNPGMWTAIHAQVNKLHQLQDGNIYRFKAGDIVQTTESAWESSYTWEYDSGTFSSQAVNASPVQNGAIIYPPGVAGGSLFRYPFGTWLVIDPTVPTPTGYPMFIQAFPFDEDLNGWQTLPGI